VGSNKDKGSNSNGGGHMQQSIKKGSGRNYGSGDGDWQRQ
jgi:hypothetical protein